MKRIEMEFFTDLQSHCKQMVQEDGYVQTQKGGRFEAEDLNGKDQSVDLQSSSFIQDHGELIAVRFVSQDNCEFELRSKIGKWYLRTKQDPIEVVIH